LSINKYGHVYGRLPAAEYAALSPEEKESRRRELNAAKLARYRERHPELAAKSVEQAKARRALAPEKHREQSRERNRRWRANNPERKKEICARYREKARELERARSRIRRKKSYWENPEKYRAAARKYSAQNRAKVALGQQKRRAILYGCRRTLTRAEWIGILDQFGWRCAYCLCWLDKPTIDHVEPLSKGGDHAADNIVPACRSCNSSKHNHSLLLWLWFKREAA
jgi:5-methylcytosine-specific restriction endonuclease McrA